MSEKQVCEMRRKEEIASLSDSTELTLNQTIKQIEIELKK